MRISAAGSSSGSYSKPQETKQLINFFCPNGQITTRIKDGCLEIVEDECDIDQKKKHQLKEILKSWSIQRLVKTKNILKKSKSYLKDWRIDALFKQIESIPKKQRYTWLRIALRFCENEYHLFVEVVKQLTRHHRIDDTSIKQNKAFMFYIHKKNNIKGWRIDCLLSQLHSLQACTSEHKQILIDIAIGLAGDNQELFNKSIALFKDETYESIQHYKTSIDLITQENNIQNWDFDALKACINSIDAHQIDTVVALASAACHDCFDAFKEYVLLFKSYDKHLLKQYPRIIKRANKRFDIQEWRKEAFLSSIKSIPKGQKCAFIDIASHFCDNNQTLFDITIQILLQHTFTKEQIQTTRTIMNSMQAVHIHHYPMINFMHLLLSIKAPPDEVRKIIEHAILTQEVQQEEQQNKNNTDSKLIDWTAEIDSISAEDRENNFITLKNIVNKLTSEEGRSHV